MVGVKNTHSIFTSHFVVFGTLDILECNKYSFGIMTNLFNGSHESERARKTVQSLTLLEKTDRIEVLIIPLLRIRNNTVIKDLLPHAVPSPPLRLRPRRSSPWSP